MNDLLDSPTERAGSPSRDRLRAAISACLLTLICVPGFAQSPPLPEPGSWIVESTVRLSPSHGGARAETRDERENECIAAENVASGSWPEFIRRDLDEDCKLEQIRQTRNSISFTQRCKDSRMEAVVTATDRRHWRLTARIVEGKDTVSAEVRSEARWIGPTC